jgi:hypothetical protein
LTHQALGGKISHSTGFVFSRTFLPLHLAPVQVIFLKTLYLFVFASVFAFASQTFYINAPERGK